MTSHWNKYEYSNGV